MKRIYGYCRISQKKQSIERQIRNIKARYPDAIIIQEAYTGTKIYGRKEFNRLLAMAKKEAAAGVEVVIVFDSVSRMSRNAAEGFAEYKALYECGIQLEFIKEPHINTAVYKDSAERQINAIATGDAAADEFMRAMTEAFNRYILQLAEKQIELAFLQAEKEVLDLQQRTKEGLETARLQGRVGGIEQGRKLTTKKSTEAKEKIRKYSKDFDGSLNDIECMQMVGVARNSFYKYKRELKEELQGQ